jgi:hypothetical protein
MCNGVSFSRICYGILSGILLIFAAVGIFFYNDNIQLSVAILSLGFLAFGLFAKKNQEPIIDVIGHPEIAPFIPRLLFALSAILMIALEYSSYKQNGVFFMVPLYMAALSIGLYWANIALYPES